MPAVGANHMPKAFSHHSETFLVAWFLVKSKSVHTEQVMNGADMIFFWFTQLYGKTSLS